MVYDSGFTYYLLPNMQNRISITMFVLRTYADRKLWHIFKLDKMYNVSENIKTLNMKDLKINCTVKIVLNFKIIIFLSIPNLIIKMSDSSTLVWFLITFIYIFLTKLKSEYIIIICIFFSLNVHIWFSGISNRTFSVCIYLLSFILNLSPPGVLQFNKRYYSSRCLWQRFRSHL